MENSKPGTTIRIPHAAQWPFAILTNLFLCRVTNSREWSSSGFRFVEADSLFPGPRRVPSPSASRFRIFFKNDKSHFGSSRLGTIRLLKAVSEKEMSFMNSCNDKASEFDSVGRPFQSARIGAGNDSRLPVAHVMNREIIDRYPVGTQGSFVSAQL